MQAPNQHNRMILADLLLVAVFLSAILGLASCQQKGPAEKAGQKIDQAVDDAGKTLESAKQSAGGATGTSAEYLDDSAITAKIKAEVLADPLLKSSQLSVVTGNGVVILSGIVDSKQSADRALQIVRSNPKVKSVENDLAVRDGK